MCDPDERELVRIGLMAGKLGGTLVAVNCAFSGTAPPRIRVDHSWFDLQAFRPNHRARSTHMPEERENTRRELTPREVVDLDTEIGFLEGLVRRDPDYVDALQILGDDYTRRGRFADGLLVDRRLSQLRPDDALVHYNLACSWALTDEPGAAVQALHRAFDLGYRDFRWLRRDPDLKQLRKHPLFKTVRERMRALSKT